VIVNIGYKIFGLSVYLLGETNNVKGKTKCAIAIGLLETMACCSPCSHESFFVVRVASGKALWLRACVYVVFFGKALRMQGCARVLQPHSFRESGEKSGNAMSAACKSRGQWAVEVCFFLFLARE